MFENKRAFYRFTGYVQISEKDPEAQQPPSHSVDRIQELLITKKPIPPFPRPLLMEPVLLVDLYFHVSRKRGPPSLALFSSLDQKVRKIHFSH